MRQHPAARSKSARRCAEFCAYYPVRGVFHAVDVPMLMAVVVAVSIDALAGGLPRLGNGHVVLNHLLGRRRTGRSRTRCDLGWRGMGNTGRVDGRNHAAFLALLNIIPPPAKCDGAARQCRPYLTSALMAAPLSGSLSNFVVPDEVRLSTGRIRPIGRGRQIVTFVQSQCGDIKARSKSVRKCAALCAFGPQGGAMFPRAPAPARDGRQSDRRRRRPSRLPPGVGRRRPSRGASRARRVRRRG